jgi:hypothetical protein
MFCLWDPMSSQYLLQYELYKIVKISKKLVVDWLVISYNKSN